MSSNDASDQRSASLLQTEKEDQVAVTGQDRDAQSHAIEPSYYDDGPSIMPSSENFAGNQDNWGASATDGWVNGAAATGATETNEWTAATATTTGVTSGW